MPRIPAPEALLEKLAPERIQSNLIRAGLFLAGWEMLKFEVQEQVRGFFCIEFDENGNADSGEYERRVLYRHKSRFEASLLWLIEANGLNESEAGRIRALRTYRNQVAHELPRMLVEPGHDVEVARIEEMRDLLGRLGRFWGGIEVDINPDFDDVDVEVSEIKSGTMLLMEHLIQAAEATADAGSR